MSTGVLVEDPSRIAGELRLISPLARHSGGHIVLKLRHLYGLTTDATRERHTRWHARTVGYVYALEDDDGREIIAYHWHPAGRSHVTLPHLHVGAGAGELRHELVKAHLETGFVTPVALLGLVVEQFDVRPRRANWDAVLESARRTLEAALS